MLLFDYRHFGASSGEPRQLVDIRRQLADWRAAIGFARGLEGVDPRRVALWGTSFSGGHVVQVAAGDDRVAAVVSQAPFTDGLSTIRSGGVAAALRLTVGRHSRRCRRAGRARALLHPVGGATRLDRGDGDPRGRARLPGPRSAPEHVGEPRGRPRGPLRGRLPPLLQALQAALPGAGGRGRTRHHHPRRPGRKGRRAVAQRRADPLPDRTLRDLRRAAVRAHRRRPDRVPGAQPDRSAVPAGRLSSRAPPPDLGRRPSPPRGPPGPGA